jgi:predicted amidohydrolase
MSCCEAVYNLVNNRQEEEEYSMPRSIKTVAIQMGAEPSPVTERLARAEILIAQAAKSGAQLAVLPEMFNTGAVYSDANYDRAEPIDGVTTRWMKSVAARYDIHVAGSFLLLDDEDIYNAMLLVAPDGQLWRYDKNYPWMWERAYFRGGSNITVADTSLGRLGMMVCWDIAHPDQWGRYAGKVDMLLVSSCPPDLGDAVLILPGGIRLRVANANPVLEWLLRLSGDAFGEKLRRQSSRMRVPVVATTGTGTFSTQFPLPRLSLALLALTSPTLWGYISRADECRIEGGFYQETYVADAAGRVLDRVAAGSENFAMAESLLADAPPQPTGAQPGFGITPLPYLLDALFNAASVSVYQRKVRSYHGSRMAPVGVGTRRWAGTSLALLAIGFLLGRFFAPRRVKIVKVPELVKEPRRTEAPRLPYVERSPRSAKGDRFETTRLLLSTALNVSRILLDWRQKPGKK